MTREAAFLGASRSGLACALLVAALCGPAAVADDGFAGVVRDALGSALPDVEVFFLADTVSHQTPVATARTGADGRFLVRDLPTGLYRIAAVKRGYGLYLGRVNTTFRSSLALVLHPIPAPGEAGAEAVPDDPSWVLRVPDRSMLRDVVSIAVAGSTEDGDDAPESPGDPLIRGDVVRAFAVDAPFAGDAGAMQGSETDFRVGGGFGDNTAVRLEGGHRGLRSVLAARELEPGRLTSVDAAEMQVGVLYRPVPDADLRVDASYASRDVQFQPEVEGLLDRTRQAARSWGVDTRWTQQLDGTSRFNAHLDYRDAAMVVPGGHPAGERGEWLEGSLASTVSVRSLQAGGSYQTVHGTRHYVQLGFDARYLEHPWPRLRATLPSEIRTSQTPGWTVRMSAEDAWVVRGPWTMTYGLGYRHVIADGESALVVPRVGASWTGRFVSMGLHVSHPTLRIWDGDTREQSATRRIDGLGYDAHVETRLGPELSLLGSISAAPVEFQYPGVAPVPRTSAWARPEYVSDGHAANEEMSLALRQQNGQTYTYLQWVRGEASGFLAVLPAFAMPYQLLAERRVEYDTGRFGVQVPGAGTDLVLEYRRRTDVPAGAPAEEASEHEEMELRLLQELFRSAAGTSWRFLFGLQIATREDEDPAAENEIVFVPDSQHQVNAGVAVAF